MNPRKPSTSRGERRRADGILMAAEKRCSPAQGAKLWSAAACCRFPTSQLAGGSEVSTPALVKNVVPLSFGSAPAGLKTGAATPGHDLNVAAEMAERAVQNPASKLAGRKAAASCRTPKLRSLFPHTWSERGALKRPQPPEACTSNAVGGTWLQWLKPLAAEDGFCGAEAPPFQQEGGPVL